MGPFQELVKLFDAFTELLQKRVDGHSLALTRILFGLLMVIDIPNERGLSIADLRWGDPSACRFPLFPFLRPLPLDGMCVVYLLMMMGAFGITLGAFYRTSSTTFFLSYWYVLLLDKSYWNNHSYLYGLIAGILGISDAHTLWSLDNYWAKSVQSQEKVAFWQYFLLRFQLFIVYFFAGIKKLDWDWIGGHSMRYLSEHWTFYIFRIFMSKGTIDLMVVHWMGFAFDLSVGFFLCFSKTRPAAYCFSVIFNAMNSQLFSIGMFPYVMMATSPIFSCPGWPKGLPTRALAFFSRQAKMRGDVREHHLEPISSSRRPVEMESKGMKEKKRKSLVSCLVLLYLAVQLSLPFSHRLTKGYNTWTEGLYGYSWDMMVHNWRSVHTRITIWDKDSGRRMYLDPELWSPSKRWLHHADMVAQFADCATRRLRKDFGITSFALYLDVWVSLNGRFTQRMYDPRMDMVTAQWSPFRRPEWVLPVMTQFEDWRALLKHYEDEVLQVRNGSLITFIADFPGLSLVNYVDPALEETSVEIMSGWVSVDTDTGYTRVLGPGDAMSLPTGHFHRVTTIRSKPASYLYKYTNHEPDSSPQSSLSQTTAPNKGITEKVSQIGHIWLKSFSLIYHSLEGLVSRSSDW